MAADYSARIDSANEQLLRALAEQLKQPLMHISQTVELLRDGGEQAELEHIETVADMALRLVDSYVLSSQLSQGQLQLELEPVSVASVLHSATKRLEKIAREYNCDIGMHLSGKYGPVMAHRESLEVAVTALGYSLIEAQSQSSTGSKQLVLAARRSRYGIVAGAFGSHVSLTGDVYRRAKLLYGKARQPLPLLSNTPSAGIFVADSLFCAMDSPLKVARHNNLTGLAATLAPNPQLQLAGT